jgi:hypothetical protein
MEAMKNNGTDDTPSTQEQEIVMRLERYEKGESIIYTWEEMIFKLKSEKEKLKSVKEVHLEKIFHTGSS